MKNRIRIIPAILLTLLALALAGCAGTPAVPGEETPDWEIKLSGLRVDTITGASLAEAKEHKSHYLKVDDYMAMPLSYIIAMIDSEKDEHPWNFDEAAWKAGYDITLTASDGYAVSFSTADVDPEALYLADTLDGQAIAPGIVGDIPSSLRIKDLASIELSLGSAETSGTFELELEVNGELSSFTREELESMPLYIEETGSYTTSAGTTHTHTYGGIKFADFLRTYVDIKDDTTITVEAMDGYTMSYGGQELMDESEGTWILAFKSDGEYLPLDPGYIRTIKVGSMAPNIDGHSSARMVKRVAVSAEAYREYELVIGGRMDNRLDRQTVQSGVSCHKQDVSYLDKKSGATEEYTGIPLWLLLAYGDDPLHAPHRQTDKSILSYKEDTALAGYGVKIIAADGYSITLDSRELNRNDDVIIATIKEGESLPEREWPLVLVWDKDAELVPEGIKAVRNITEIQLIFD